jgi:hypothetical protein
MLAIRITRMGRAIVCCDCSSTPRQASQQALKRETTEGKGGNSCNGSLLKPHLRSVEAVWGINARQCTNCFFLVHSPPPCHWSCVRPIPIPSPSPTPIHICCTCVVLITIVVVVVVLFLYSILELRQFAEGYAILLCLHFAASKRASE